MIANKHPKGASVLAYAEVHYRPRAVPSLIFSKWPEIVCDTPPRVDPDRPIPVFIIIKDAHRYPVRLEMAVVHMKYENGSERIARFPYGGIQIREPAWWDSINVMPEFTGMVVISLNLLVRNGKQLTQIGVDNYRGLSHSPLTVTVAEQPLPGGENWYHGDMHCHTLYTSDQVEFGAPLEAMVSGAYCMGYHWLASTDHSYDLDDSGDDYLESDPLLGKWRFLKEQAELLSPTVTVIPGEEVTCRTSSGKNCHLLALNHERFIEGSGDSGERGLKTDSERTVGEAVRECVEWNGIACAAHPLESIPLLERLLLGRGEWTRSDLETPELTGLQFHNGIRDRGFRDGRDAWILFLLAGRRLVAYGGSDAHGDMNRRRRVMLPFLALGEDMFHTFGAVRTVVNAASRERDHLIRGLREGRVVVTEGPFISLSVTGNGSAAGIGDSFTEGAGTIRALCKSSREFGLLKSVRILGGTTGEQSERVLAAADAVPGDYEWEVEQNERFDGNGYIRAECDTDLGKCCFTNPVWIERG